MVVEYTRYVIPADRHAAFELAYKQAAEYLKRSPECVGFELSHCEEESDRYTLRIEWRSTDEHLQGFRKGPEFPGFLALVRPFGAQIQEMQHYELTDVVWKRDA